MPKTSTLTVLPFALLAFAVFTPTARADFEISVESGTITPGGELQLEIGIESSEPSIPEPLADYFLILQITPLTATGGSSLEFVEPQAEAMLEDADYVFAETSDVLRDIADGITDATTVADNLGDSIAFNDLSFPVDDLVDVDVTTRKLFVTFEVEHLLGGLTEAEAIGQQYEIAVDTEDSELFNSFDLDSTPFTSTPGIVTVAAVAIPEPTSAGLLAFAACGIFLRRRR